MCAGAGIRCQPVRTAWEHCRTRLQGKGISGRARGLAWAAGKWEGLLYNDRRIAAASLGYDCRLGIAALDDQCLVQRASLADNGLVAGA